MALESRYFVSLEDIEDAIDAEALVTTLREEMLRLLSVPEEQALKLLYEDELPDNIAANIVGILSDEKLDSAEFNTLQNGALEKLRNSEKLKAFFA
jgi:hypothetical protein